MKRLARLILPLVIATALGFIAGHVSYTTTTRLLRLAGTTTGLSKLDRELNAKLVGRRVPAIPLRSADGGAADLASLVPPPALVVFYSDSCSHCKALRSTLDSKRAAGELDPLHLVLIGVDDATEAGTSTKATAWPEGWLRGFLPHGEENLTIRSTYGLFLMPAIWFVGPKGEVISRMNGYGEFWLDRRIRRLLRTVERPPA